MASCHSPLLRPTSVPEFGLSLLAQAQNGSANTYHIILVILGGSFCLHGNVAVVPFHYLLLNHRCAGHTEDAVNVDADFDLHFGTVPVRLWKDILNSEVPLGEKELPSVWDLQDAQSPTMQCPPHPKLVW